MVLDIVKTGDTLKTLPTKYAKEDKIKITSDVNISKLIEGKYDEDKVKIEYTGEEEINSTTKKGTKVGTFKISYDNELLKEMPAIMNAELHFSVLKYLKENIIYYLGLIIIIIFTIKILSKPKRRKRR